LNLPNGVAQILGLIIIVIDALVSFLLAQTGVEFDPGTQLVLGGISVVVTTAGLYLNVRMPGQSTAVPRGQAAVGYIGKFIVAIVIGVVVWLVCTFVGRILVDLGVPIADTAGSLLVQFAVVLGFLAALWHFFVGFTPHPPA